MSTDLLVELPKQVLKAFALPQTNGPFLKSALVVVQADSISVIHGENGSLYHHHSFSKKATFGKIIDCAYVHTKRALVVAFSGRRVVSFPIDCKDASACEDKEWPFQIEHLFSADGRTVIVTCEGGYVAALTLSESGDVPSPPSAWDRATQSSGQLAIHTSAKHVVAVTSTVTAGQKKQKQVVNSALALSVMTIPSVLEGSCAAISPAQAIATSVQLEDGEIVVGAVCLSASESVCLVTNRRWIKLSLDGSVLFERSAPTAAPIYATEAGDQLCILGSDKVLRFYDTRFGTEVRSVTVGEGSKSSDAGAPAAWLALYPADGSKSSASVASVQLITTKAVGATGSCNVYRRIVGLETQEALTSCLCRSIGRLAQPTAMSTEAAPLSSAGKRQLQDALTAYAEEQAAAEGEQNGDSAKRRRSSISVSRESSTVFLAGIEKRSLDSIAAGSVLAAEGWEWELLTALARSGDLSIARNPSLLSVAAKARRLDVLVAVVEFAADLSERQCVQVLAHVMLMPDDDLGHTAVQNGVLAYQATQNGVAQEGDDGKKGKKGKSADKKATASGTSGVDATLRLNVLRCFVEAVLRRTSAYSAILLSEAVRLLSASSAVVLLRVVVLCLRTLTKGENNSVEVASVTSDEQLRRAATWAEALLDGHFSALALNAVTHAPTRRALTSAIDTVSAVDESSELLQGAFGLWTHVNRVIRKGGQQVKPITSLYQVESLDLR